MSRQLLLLLLPLACADTNPWRFAPQPKLFEEPCQKVMACDCRVYQFQSSEICTQDMAARMAATQTEAEVLGLSFDEACFLSSTLDETKMGCLGHAEWKDLNPEEIYFGSPYRCGACSPVHGDVEEGEPCMELNSTSSDCRQGLFCLGDPPRCVDPCVIVEEGTPCDGLEVVCHTGYETKGIWDERFTCDEQKNICRGGELGQPCVNDSFCGGPNRELVCNNTTGLCEARLLGKAGDPCDAYDACETGLVCAWNEEGDRFCLVPAEEKESCTNTSACQKPLRCSEGNVCVRFPGEGEACAPELPQCDLYLRCSENGICVPDPPAVCSQ